MTRSDYTPPTFTDVAQAQWASPPVGAVALDSAHLNAMAQAIGNSARQTLFDARDYGATGNGTTNDTGAINSALTAAGSAGGTVYLPPGTYAVTTGSLTLDVTKQAIRGDRAKLKFTGSGNGITLVGSVYPPYEQGRTVLDGISLQGTSRSGVGLYIGATAADGRGPSHTLYRNLTVSGFASGVRYGDHGYATTFLGCDFYNNAICVDLPSTVNDAGERLLFVGCTIFNSAVGISNHENGGSMMLLGCSLDYNTTQIDLADGRITAVGCHIEGDDPTYGSSYPITMTGDAALTILGGRITGTTSAIPAFVNNNSTGPGLVIRDAELDGMRTAGYFINGNGWSDIDILTLGNDNNARVTQVAANLLANGTFESATLGDDLVFISLDTAAITSRTSGTNINLTSDTTQFHSGTRSLKAAKVSSSAPSNAHFIIATALPKRGVKMGAELWYRKPSSTSGWLYIGFHYGRIETNSAGLPIITKDNGGGTTEVVLPSAPVPWTKWSLAAGSLDRPPMWATHFWIEVSMDWVTGPDAVYIDDAIFTSGI